jgi:hypothetical protein
MLRAVGMEVGDERLIGERAQDKRVTNYWLEIELNANFDRCYKILSCVSDCFCTSVLRLSWTLDSSTKGVSPSVSIAWEGF